MEQKVTGYVGLGYVGLPEALYRSVKTHDRVVGYDIDISRICDVNHRQNPFQNEPFIDRMFSQGARIEASSNPNVLMNADHIVIAVPTPVTHDKKPDYSLIEKAASSIAPYVFRGDAVILVSTVGPGVCERVLKKTLEEKTNLKVGEDIFCIYSPETINPGDTINTPDKLSHVVSAFSEKGLQRGMDFYRQCYDNVFSCADVRAAELAKCLTNTYRNVNIALVNELAVACERYGVDFQMVADAAKTKGFAFEAHSPSRGVGGHCIPVDPYFLVQWAKEVGVDLNITHAGLKQNEQMPYHTVDRLAEALNEVGLPVNGSVVTVVGYAYKKNVGDPRESPTEVIVDEILRRKGTVMIVDELVEEFPEKHQHLVVSPLEAAIDGSTAVVIATGHDSMVNGEFLDMLRIHKVKAVVDGDNSLARVDKSLFSFIYRGIGRQ